MARSPKKPVKRKEAEAVETEPDAWPRFERAVDVLVKTSPKPKKTSNKPKGDR